MGASGKVCQRWSDQEPNVHTRTHAKFPLAGLGGHNFCRNPDGSEVHPWCYSNEFPDGPRFELCDVGAPAKEKCPPPPPPMKHIKPADSLLANLEVTLEESAPATTLGIGVI